MHEILSQILIAMGRARLQTHLPAADTAGMIEDLASALRTGLVHVPPGAALFREVLKTGSAEALETLFDVRGAAPYREMVTDRFRPWTDDITHGRFDILAPLHAAGFDLAPDVHLILRHGLRHDRIAALHFVRTTLANPMPLPAAIRDLTRLEAMSRPWAEDMMAGMQALMAGGLDRRDALSLRRLLCQDIRIMSLRSLALALALGDSLAERHAHNLHHLGPRARALVEATESAHGRLMLADMEPDPADLLARPATAAFYGMTPDMYQAERDTMRRHHRNS